MDTRAYLNGYMDKGAADGKVPNVFNTTSNVFPDKPTNLLKGAPKVLKSIPEIFDKPTNLLKGTPKVLKSIPEIFDDAVKGFNTSSGTKFSNLESAGRKALPGLKSWWKGLSAEGKAAKAGIPAGILTVLGYLALKRDGNKTERLGSL